MSATVFVEIVRPTAFDFGSGDFLAPPSLLNCGCVGSFTSGPVARLVGASAGRTSLFFLFAPGSNHSFVIGPLTRGAPPRTACPPASGDVFGTDDCPAQGGTCETSLNSGALLPSAFHFAVVATKVSASPETCCKRPATSKWLKVTSPT